MNITLLVFFFGKKGRPFYMLAAAFELIVMFGFYYVVWKLIR